jgi:hypothetical protein
MNGYSHDIYRALASERIDRYQAEAESHRRAKAARGRRARAVDRLVLMMDQGMSVIRTGLAADRRRRIPAI